MIVEGSLLLAGESVRITAQLIRADTDEHLWAESYQREVRDILALQSEVAQAIAQEIKKVFFDEMYRSESRRVLATLIRLLGDFDLGGGGAAGSVRGGGRAMASRWDPSQSTGMARFDRPIQGHRCGPSPGSAGCIVAETVARRLEQVAGANAVRDDQEIEDDRLRLIFTCCHPALPADARKWP